MWYCQLQDSDKKEGRQEKRGEVGSWEGERGRVVGASGVELSEVGRESGRSEVEWQRWEGGKLSGRVVRAG